MIIYFIIYITIIKSLTLIFIENIRTNHLDIFVDSYYLIKFTGMHEYYVHWDLEKFVVLYFCVTNS